jgi:hypothetical protein
MPCTLFRIARDTELHKKVLDASMHGYVGIKARIYKFQESLHAERCPLWMYLDMKQPLRRHAMHHFRRLYGH